MSEDYGLSKERGRERRLRKRLARMGYQLKKSRQHTVTADDHGEYMVIHADTNSVAAGEHFDYTLDDVDAWTGEQESAEEQEGAGPTP